MQSFLIAATSSGCGKTTFTMGLLRLLRNKGLRVQPFKCGPDYIDTMWHTMAAGRESVNLDLWMNTADGVRTLFERYSKDADVCVVEGVMGMFDGYDKDKGSCADIAKVLDIPVVLLVNAKSMAYSAAAMIYGFTHFDPKVKIAGVVFNQVSSESHFAYLKKACEDAGVECWGYIRKEKGIELPSRHLGLTIDERFRIDEYIERVATLIGNTVAMPTITEQAAPVTHSNPQPSAKSIHIAIARDEAFNFTYRHVVDELAARGKVSFFSPIADEHIPEGTDFLYLPGGYPEFYLQQLSSNKNMLQSIRNYINSGGRGIAECGGMLYLCKSIIGMDGQEYAMADVLNLQGTFEGMKLHLGYRKLIVGNKECRGHEFHYSDISELDNPPETVGNQYNAKGEAVSTKLYRKHNFYAGYTHWGFSYTF